MDPRPAENTYEVIGGLLCRRKRPNPDPVHPAPPSTRMVPPVQSQTLPKHFSHNLSGPAICGEFPLSLTVLFEGILQEGVTHFVRAMHTAPKLVDTAIQFQHKCIQRWKPAIFREIQKEESIENSEKERERQREIRKNVEKEQLERVIQIMKLNPALLDYHRKLKFHVEIHRKCSLYLNKISALVPLLKLEKTRIRDLAYPREGYVEMLYREMMVVRRKIQEKQRRLFRFQRAGNRHRDLEKRAKTAAEYHLFRQLWMVRRVDTHCLIQRFLGNS